MRKINLHIIHCADTPDHLHFTVDDIRKWHTDKPPEGRGWADIGYHYVIYRDGTIHEGRRIEITGAHCRGKNTNSIGTCLIGRLRFTPAQFDTLQQHHYNMIERFGKIELAGHREFDKHKTCPNFEVKGWWDLNRLKDSSEKKETSLKKNWLERLVEMLKSIFNK